MPKRARAKSYGARTQGRKAMRSSRAGYDPRRLTNYVARPVPVTMYGGVVPDRIIVPMRYCEVALLSGSILGYESYIYNMNSTFDPSVTVTGHQPLGRDQWATLYNQYRVLKATIVVDFTQQQSTQPVLCGLSPSETAAIFTNSAAEQPGAKTTLVSQDTCGPNTKRLSLTMDCMKFLGDPGARYKDSTAALMSASPAEPVYVHVWASNALGGTTVDVVASVSINMEVELFNRIPLSQS